MNKVTALTAGYFGLEMVTGTMNIFKTMYMIFMTIFQLEHTIL